MVLGGEALGAAVQDAGDEGFWAAASDAGGFEKMLGGDADAAAGAGDGEGGGDVGAAVVGWRTSILLVRRREVSCPDGGKVDGAVFFDGDQLDARRGCPLLEFAGSGAGRWMHGRQLRPKRWLIRE